MKTTTLHFLACGRALKAECACYKGRKATYWEPAEPADVCFYSLIDEDTGEDCMELIENPKTMGYVHQAADEAAYEFFRDEYEAHADAIYQAWKDSKLIGEQA